MKEEIVELTEDVSGSPLYSEDLAPVPVAKRTWSTWNLAAIWVGMAVCIPTYMLASFMMKSGMSWYAALAIIGLANLVITVPMALNGHAGVKYGIPFPVLGRASFGTNLIHLPSIVRAIVACGWFGIQTWIGGLAIYAIWNAATGNTGATSLDAGQFICFGIFWFINMFFIWRGTESIKWLEEYSAPILILIGILLIIWGSWQAGGFGTVLDQSSQLEKPSVQLIDNGDVYVFSANPIRDVDGNVKASEYALMVPGQTDTTWIGVSDLQAPKEFQKSQFPEGSGLRFSLRAPKEDGTFMMSSEITVMPTTPQSGGFGSQLWSYILWFTAMVGFWATMALSICDITRYTKTQKSQVRGQFIGLPGTMILFSFVGIFVTCAAVINFDDILIADDAPWDPVSLLAKFESPTVVIIAQIFMLIATLSTNIAANVIAPANAFSNLLPKQISFKTGGTITGILGIALCPWWTMNEISDLLIFVSGLLGPVLGILLCDYFVIRKTRMRIADLYKTNGAYAYGGSGINIAAFLALLAGILFAVVGYWVPALSFLYSLSWFTGFFVAFMVYMLLMMKQIGTEPEPTYHVDRDRNQPISNRSE